MQTCHCIKHQNVLGCSLETKDSYFLSFKHRLLQNNGMVKLITFIKRELKIGEQFICTGDIPSRILLLYPGHDFFYRIFKCGFFGIYLLFCKLFVERKWSESFGNLTGDLMNIYTISKIRRISLSKCLNPDLPIHILTKLVMR